MTTSFRQDVVAGFKAILDAFAAANPTLLRATYSQRPTSYREFPLAFIGERNELVTYDASTYNREMTPTVVLVDTPNDPDAVMDRMDIVVDALLDAFRQNPHIPGYGWWGRVTITDTVEVVGDVFYPVVIFAFGDVSTLEGRT
jgi:hypothetical protein